MPLWCHALVPAEGRPNSTSAVVSHSSWPQAEQPTHNIAEHHREIQTPAGGGIDASLCLCAVHDALVQGASLAGQKPGKGRRCSCARLKYGASSPLAVLFHLHSQECPVNEVLSESGHSSEDGQSGEKASAMEIFSLHIPGQDHTHCRLHRDILTGSHCMVQRAETNW